MNKVRMPQQIIPPLSRNWIKADLNFVRTECKITMHIDPRNVAPGSVNELWINHTPQELDNLIRMLQWVRQEMIDKGRALM